jgi:hypothetical protein
MCEGAHTEFLDDLGDILVLAESENPLLSIHVNSSSKEPRGWSEIFNLESLGEYSLESGEEPSGLSCEDGVVDVYNHDVDEFFR